MKTKIKKYDDEFSLYNLKVSIVGNEKDFVCKHTSGKAFEVVGENLVFKKDARISLYALSAILPLIPAKQRSTDKNDWMTTDAEVACPDPNCKARFKIERVGKKVFRHGEATITKLKK